MSRSQSLLSANKFETLKEKIFTICLAVISYKTKTFETKPPQGSAEYCSTIIQNYLSINDFPKTYCAVSF